MSYEEIKTDLPKALRAKGVAKEFSISLSHVWLLAKEGKITPISVSPRVTIFETQELLRFFSVAEVHNEK